MTDDNEVSQRREQQLQPTKRLKRTKPVWRLFPPKQQQQQQQHAAYSFCEGDAVFIKPQNGTNQEALVRGTVVSLNSESGEVKVLVNGSKDQKESVDIKEQKRLIPCFGILDPTIVIVPETNHFRQMVHQVERADTVLEIGCSTGETSRLLIRCSNAWVGLDTSQQMIDQCKNSLDFHKNCHICKVDALMDPKRALIESKTRGDPSVVFVDIGGNREIINVLRMISWVLDGFAPRLVVVKSRELVQSIRSSANVHGGTGLVEDGDTWYQNHQQRPALPKHPLRAPFVLSPRDGLTPICRYHNYHKDGCSKKSGCSLDHEYCHACLNPGHVARECPLYSY